LRTSNSAVISVLVIVQEAVPFSLRLTAVLQPLAM
jgi:hypothetical protein